MLEVKNLTFKVKDENGKVQGFVLPESVAPYKLQIIPKMDNEEKVREANELYNKLSEKTREDE